MYLFNEKDNHLFGGTTNYENYRIISNNGNNKNNVFYGTFLGGYTGTQVRESASNSSSSSSNTSTTKTTTTSKSSTTSTSKTTTSTTSNKSYGTALGGGASVPKETMNRTTSSSAGGTTNKNTTTSSGSRTTTTTNTSSKSSSSSTTGTTSKSNFLGGYTGTQVRESASSSKKTVVTPNFNATANVNTNINGLDYLLNTKVGYLQYNGHNPGGRVDNNFKPGVSLQTFDLTYDAINRGKNVTSTATQNIEKASNKYTQVQTPTGGGILGGYKGTDVLKDAGITPTKNNESIFKKVGNFFKESTTAIVNKVTGNNGTKTSQLSATMSTNNQPELEALKAGAISGISDKIDFDKAKQLQKINAYQSISGKQYLNNYSEEDIDRLAALMFREAGGSFKHGSDEEWFAFLNTGAVALNNAYDKGTGDTFADKLCSLSNNVYQGLSSYATSDFDTVTQGASEAEKADLRKAAELVLSGQYTLPSNMHLQASESIVNTYGTSWNTHNVDHDFGYGNIHIGYDTGSTVSDTDIYGNKVSSDVNDYRELAAELRNVSDSIGQVSTEQGNAKFQDLTNPNDRVSL
ncbi:MAG: hypothetical protein ACI4U4_01700 [Bacilli bacterium]